MTSVPQQADQQADGTAAQALGQWTQTTPGVYERICIGQEHSASYNQNMMDGHTELSIYMQFHSSIHHSQLVQRGRNAWLLNRLYHPEIALELSTDLRVPQTMIFRAFQTNQDAQQWLDETLVVLYDRDLDQVNQMTYNRRLPTRGKQAMFYLLIDTTGKKQHSVIYNVSHAVVDVYSIVALLRNMLTQMVTCKETNDLDVTSLAYDQKEAIRRLPVSPIVSYEEKYKPTRADREKSLSEARAQIELMQTKMSESIAMLPLESHAQREHYTHSLVSTYTPQESREILAALKKAKMSVSYAGAAATILAVKEMYGKGTEKGALMGMTRNARRWVETELTAKSGKAIPMATDVVFLWIPFDEDMQGAELANQLCSLSAKIRDQLAPHLRDPHYLASTQFMSDTYVESLRQRHEQEQEAIASGKTFVEQVGPSAPGFSPQGVLQIQNDFVSGQDWIKRTAFNHTGRQINASPWIGLLSVDGCLKMSLGFDSKYYEPEDMHRFLALAKRNLASLLACSPTPRASKL